MRVIDICKLLVLVAMIAFQGVIVFTGLHSRVAQGIVIGDAMLFVFLFVYQFIEYKYTI